MSYPEFDLDECYPHIKIDTTNEKKIKELSLNLEKRNSDNSFMKKIINDIDNEVFNNNMDNDVIIENIVSILNTYRLSLKENFTNFNEESL